MFTTNVKSGVFKTRDEVIWVKRFEKLKNAKKEEKMQGAKSKKFSIRLENFRCYQDKTFEFHKEHSTLLMGKSGAGKTSICEAFLFVLYDGVTKPASFGSKRCRVTLTDGDFVITRQKDPNLLQLTFQGKVYEDDVAQSVIERIYGNRKVFLSSCYIRQMERNLLFYGTNSQKLDLIRQISLGDFEPEDYRKQASEIAKGLESNIQTLAILHGKKVGAFDQYVSDQLANLSPEQLIHFKELDVSSFSSLLGEMEKKIPFLQQEIARIQSLSSNLYHKRNQVENLQNQMKKISIPDTLLIEVELKEIDQILKNVDIERLATKKELEKIIQKQSTLVKPLQSAQELEESLIEQREIITLLSQIRCSSIVVLGERKEKVETDIKNAKSSIKQLQATFDFQQNQQQGTVVKCPNCKTVLVYNNGTLDYKKEQTGKAETNKVVTEKDLIEKRQYLRNLENDLENVEEIIEKLEGKTQVSISELEKQLSILKQIEELQREREKLESKPTIEITEEEYKNNKSKRDLLVGQLLEASRKGTELQVIKTQLDSLLEEVKEMELGLKECNLEEMKKELEVVQGKKEMYEKGLKMKAILVKKEEMEQEIEKISKEISLLERKKQGFLLFRQKVSDTECIYLDRNIQILNEELSSLLPKFFDTPITVTLKSSKTLKNESLKYQFNISIFYRNNEFDDIDQLSGGEQSRLSLALTLAFMKLTKKKLLILDESLNALDVDLKASILDILISLQKTLIVVSHDELQGPFDHLLCI